MAVSSRILSRTSAVSPWFAMWRSPPPRIPPLTSSPRSWGDPAADLAPEPPVAVHREVRQGDVASQRPRAVHVDHVPDVELHGRTVRLRLDPGPLIVVHHPRGLQEREEPLQLHQPEIACIPRWDPRGGTRPSARWWGVPPPVSPPGRRPVRCAGWPWRRFRRWAGCPVWPCASEPGPSSRTVDSAVDVPTGLATITRDVNSGPRYAAG